MSNRKKNNEKATFLSQLPLAIKTGKYEMGIKKTIKSVINGSCKHLVLASNIQNHHRMQLEYYRKLTDGFKIEYYTGTNNDLSSLLGLKCRTSVVSIIDAGEADLNIEA
ncbi:RL30 [Hepatospora eriocheir]|uniref:RL30 n=1 Tax=Hepatospora eriocheir TaxID=1081669 RepID=A0A1X0QIM1_9MICR|nr:RL30 [Hepatospora eriocheir]